MSAGLIGLAYSAKSTKKSSSITKGLSQVQVRRNLPDHVRLVSRMIRLILLFQVLIITGSYKRIDNQIVANDWNDLTSGNLRNGIIIDEFGNNITSPLRSQAWTNTSSDGNSLGDQNNCNSFTSTTGSQSKLILTDLLFLCNNSAIYANYTKYQNHRCF